MPILYTAPMATVEQVKGRLGVASTDTSLDTVLQEALEAVSAEIEREARRRLRRAHRVTEYASGGSRLIALRYYPIANIESVRESEDRDFTTSGAYTELVEGVDYVIEPGNGLPGETGLIRRLDQDWLGSDRDPSKVQIIYTGGFKTPTELALEGQTITIEGTTNIKDFAVKRSQGVDPEYYARDYEEDAEIKFRVGEPADPFLSEIAVVRFDLTQENSLVLPSWQIIEATFTAAWRKDAASSAVPINVALIHDADPIQSSLQALWEAAREGLGLADGTLISADFEDVIVTVITSEVSRELVRKTAGEGYIAFGFYVDEADSDNEGVLGWLKSSEANSGTRPSIEIKYQNRFADGFAMPDDLRNACLIQAIHEFQRRATPGRVENSMRGISIASGSFEKHTELDLLPGVRAVAQSYRRKH